MAADDGGTRDWGAAYNGEGPERAANNDGIRQVRYDVFGGGRITRLEQVCELCAQRIFILFEIP